MRKIIVRNLKGLSLILVFLFIQVSIFLPTLLFSNVDIAWIKRYNSPANGDDWAYALALDNNGNIYVAGVSYGSGTFGDYCVVKYDQYGNEIWVRRYNGPKNYWDGAYALAVDNYGNVYVTGVSYDISGDYCTIKYDPNGNELWVRRYNGPGNGWDIARAIAVDNYGNVYVTGESYGLGTSYDYATIKYDALGNEIWVRRYNGPADTTDGAYAIAVDNFGNVYVTGYSFGYGTLSDFVTIKYAPDGQELWVRRYNGEGNGYDLAYNLVLDNQNNVYVTGGSERVGSSYDYCTIKYDQEGALVWVKRYNGQANYIDLAQAITVDNYGNIYVTGFSYTSGTSYDYCTVKYDQQGNEIWIRKYNGPGQDWDISRVLAVDSDGNVYVAGESYDLITDNDYCTVKYDQEGNELWVERYNGPANYIDEIYGLAVDNYGNVYVTGVSDGLNTAKDYCTIKYVQQVGTNERKSFKITKGNPKGTYKIYDISGKLIKDKRLKKGIYFKETEKGKEKILILK